MLKTSNQSTKLEYDALELMQQHKTMTKPNN